MCNMFEILSGESKNFQQKRHFEKEHANYTDQDTSFFQRNVDNVKRSKSKPRVMYTIVQNQQWKPIIL